MDLERIKELLANRLNELGYELYSLRTRREKKDLILEVVIDRVKTINMDDIVFVSNELNTLLDKEDPIEEAYFLDISSLGAEKPLKIESLKDYVGSFVNVHLINPVDGENIYEGTLVSVSDDNVVISYRVKTRTKQMETQLSNISKIRLAIKF